VREAVTTAPAVPPARREPRAAPPRGCRGPRERPGPVFAG